MKRIFFCFLFFLVNLLSAQSINWTTLTFVPTYNNSPLQLKDTYYKISAEDSIQIENLQFYISQIEFYQEEELVFSQPKSFHLIDAAVPQSLIQQVVIPEHFAFSHVKFNIGIDSLTNVSGAMGGDLDPTKGMYWTWQSGYINFKLEGSANNCPARKNRFQFHIGGYQLPYYALQEVLLPITNTDEIKIIVALDQLLTKINLEDTYEVMSPSHQSLEMAQQLPILFSVVK